MCICSSMLTIKTIFTLSNHLIALGPSSINWSDTACLSPAALRCSLCSPDKPPGRFFAPSVDRQGCCTKGQIRQFKWQKCVVSQLFGCEGRCIEVHSEVVREESAALSAYCIVLSSAVPVSCDPPFVTWKHVPCADFSLLRTPIFLDRDSPSGVSLTWLSRETRSELVQTKHSNAGNLGEDTLQPIASPHTLIYIRTLEPGKQPLIWL